MGDNIKIKTVNMTLSSCRRTLITMLTSAAAFSSSLSANAELITELLEKSKANKDLNDKKRLATSYANLAMSRTVTDKTCSFPNNFFGCQNTAELGNVKFLTDDIKIECEGKDGKCASKSKGF